MRTDDVDTFANGGLAPLIHELYGWRYSNFWKFVNQLIQCQENKKLEYPRIEIKSSFELWEPLDLSMLELPNISPLDLDMHGN